MKAYKEFLFALVGLAIIVSGFYAAWVGVGWLFSAVLGLDVKTRTTVLTVSGTLVSAVLTIVLGQYYSKLKDLRESQRPKKIEIYSKVIEWTVSYMHMHFSKRKSNVTSANAANTDVGSLGSEQEDPRAAFERELQKLLPELIMWASPGVLNACQKIGSTSYYDEEHVLRDVENIYKEMRKDIGLSNAGLVESGILNVAFRRR